MMFVLLRISTVGILLIVQIACVMGTVNVKSTPKNVISPVSTTPKETIAKNAPKDTLEFRSMVANVKRVNAMGKPENATTKAANVTAQRKELSEISVNVAISSITIMETPLKIPVTMISPLIINSPLICLKTKTNTYEASISKTHLPKPTLMWTFQSPVQSQPK